MTAVLNKAPAANVRRVGATPKCCLSYPASARARERGAVLALSGLSEPVRLALELAGVMSEFTIEK